MKNKNVENVMKSRKDGCKLRPEAATISDILYLYGLVL